MPALAGIDLLRRLKETSAPKCRFIPKSGGNPIKAEIVEVLFGKNKHEKGEGVTLIPEDGASQGKKIFVSVERIKGMQGRQPGFSPAKKDSPADESPAPVKNNKGKTAAKAAPEKKVQKSAKNDETFDLESAREEMKDIAEALSDLMERATAIASFIETLEMGQTDTADESPDEDAEDAEDEEEEKPAPKAARGKAKSGSRKPRHEDSDED